MCRIRKGPKLFNTHNQEIKAVTYGLIPKFEELLKVLIPNYRQIKHTVEKWKERQRRMDSKQSQLHGHTDFWILRQEGLDML
jgi:hypothetical protein